MENENTNMPPWARKVDDYGRRCWHKKKPGKSYRGEYIWSVIWNLIWLFIVNKVPDWNIPFINDRYQSVLWALNLNIFIQIGCYALMFIINHHSIRHLGKILMGIAGFLMLILLYYIYPFDFSGINGWTWMDTVLPIIFIIGMVGTAIGTIVNLWKLVFWRE
jgi:hypothetical protein